MIERRAMELRVALLLAAVVLVCASAALAATSAHTLAFHTVARGRGFGSMAAKRAVYVARDEARWRRLWRELNAGHRPQRPLPRVDFSGQMVILVTQGQKPNGGYGITVDHILDTGQRLVVTVAERTPGANCVTPQVITAPYHAVRVRRTGKPVAVERRRVVIDCPV